MPIERKETTLANGGMAVEEIYAASKPQPFAIVENGVVIDNIVADADEYSLEQIQDLFGGGNLVKPMPEDYGVGDFYDAGADEWTKAEPPQGFSFDEDEENEGRTNDRTAARADGRQA